MTDRLPLGWLETTIGEVFRTAGGGTPPTSRSEFWGNGVPWITSADIDEAGDISPRKAVTLSGIACSATNPVPPGSVIIVTRVGLGKVGLATQEICFSQDCQALLFSPQLLDPLFIAHQIRRTVCGIRGRGTTIAGVTVNQLGALPFILAPLPEQHRIVEAVDSYLSRLDDAVASLERVQAKLKAYRASVLKAAVEGHLVPSEASLARAERRAYEPAEALLARILAERRRRWEETELDKLKAAGKTPKDDNWKAKYLEPLAPDTSTLPDLPEGWTWATTEAVADVVDPQPSHRTPSEVEGGIPYVGMGDVEDGKVKLDRVRRVGAEILEEHRTRYSLRDGDFVFGKIGTLGRPALLPQPFEYTLSANLVLVQPDPDMARAFHFFWMQSPGLNRIVARDAKSTSQPAFGIKKVRALPVPIAPIIEQVRIVEEVERQLSLQLATARIVKDQLVRLRRLRQSILKWAFEGRLVDQTPTDEPAERLLARIRVERAAVASLKNPRGRIAEGAA